MVWMAESFPIPKRKCQKYLFPQKLIISSESKPHGFRSDLQLLNWHSPVLRKTSISSTYLTIVYILYIYIYPFLPQEEPHSETSPEKLWSFSSRRGFQFIFNQLPKDQWEHPIFSVDLPAEKQLPNLRPLDQQILDVKHQGASCFFSPPRGKTCFFFTPPTAGFGFPTFFSAKINSWKPPPGYMVLWALGNSSNLQRCAMMGARATLIFWDANWRKCKFFFFFLGGGVVCVKKKGWEKGGTGTVPKDFV